MLSATAFSEPLWGLWRRSLASIQFKTNNVRWVVLYSMLLSCISHSNILGVTDLSLACGSSVVHTPSDIGLDNFLCITKRLRGECRLKDYHNDRGRAFSGVVLFRQPPPSSPSTQESQHPKSGVVVLYAPSTSHHGYERPFIVNLTTRATATPEHDYSCSWWSFPPSFLNRRVVSQGRRCRARGA